MDKSFFKRLEEQCRKADSLLCVGLDPHADDLLIANAEAARDFCFRLIDATTGQAAAYKPNSAFFEIYGARGMQALAEVITRAKQTAPVILDAKRGDIGSTSQGYAKAAFKTLGADALTVSPYLGKDAIDPFIAVETNGIFLLCKTSNPGASDLQDLNANGQTIYAHVAEMAQAWNALDNVGLVVGATYPDVLTELRELVPDLWFLAPGVGTQGGDLASAVQAGLRKDGFGLLLPISRAISRASDPAAAARKFRDEIDKAREGAKKAKPGFANKQLADDLLRLGCVKFGDFTLKSGQHSPFYFDLRRLVGDPAVLGRAATACIRIMCGLKFDRIAGVPYAALPIATAISLQAGWPLIYPRKETKEYGTKSNIEGPYQYGETVVLIDDLITTGGSKVESIQKLGEAGLKVSEVVVLIDRRSQKEETTASFTLHSVFQIADLLDYWFSSGAITPQQHADVLKYLQTS